MRFGICADYSVAALVAEAGFEYLESGLSALGMLDQKTFEQIQGLVMDSGLRVEAFNSMLAPAQRLTGPMAEHGRALEALAVAFPRAAALGAQVVVFGSGGARQVPEGWPMGRALEQLTEFLRQAGPLAASHGIALAVEPLRPGECNIIHTVAEGLALAQAAAQPNIGVLADWYHMTDQDEGVAGILQAKGALLHCHIAAPVSRHYPLSGDGADYSAFFGALRSIGYAGRVSIEGGGSPEEYADALARLKSEVL